MYDPSHQLRAGHNYRERLASEALKPQAPLMRTAIAAFNVIPVVWNACYIRGHVRLHDQASCHPRISEAALSVISSLQLDLNTMP